MSRSAAMVRVLQCAAACPGGRLRQTCHIDRGRRPAARRARCPQAELCRSARASARLCTRPMSDCAAMSMFRMPCAASSTMRRHRHHSCRVPPFGFAVLMRVGVGRSHDCFAGLRYDASKCRSVEDFSPTISPIAHQTDRMWRSRMRRAKTKPLNFAGKSRACGASRDTGNGITCGRS